MKQVAKKSQFPAMLEQFKSEIARALPLHLSADRMARIALTAFRRSPKLANCEPASVFAAVIQASQLGLEPDTQGRSYLVPYGKECQFIPGWKGLVDLVNRAGNASVWTGAVFQGDEFNYQLGTDPKLDHKPKGGYDPDTITHIYAVGRVKGSENPVIECWTMNRVRAHRDKYNKVGKSHYSFGNMEMYARKVVLLQVLKYMPMSIELERAVDLSRAAEEGKQRLTVESAIDGTWERVDQDQPAAQEVKQPVRKSAPEPTQADAGSKMLSDDDIKVIREKIAAINLDEADLLVDMGFDSLADIPRSRFAGVMDFITEVSKK